ncbi:MAG: polycis-undecaprenyl-diphosphate synthase [Candidatus Ordinivivax streblomastigis]|uniref:Isoprenyl transferase n=1 Tax=Candidatus Ordinivivax streblomastigis TaxID=2540710 RepID=A0A5M8P0T9_9BACT|nr:MAG: polycis-undecaprenyl-diphosphate synthase [Candidatus Ordinivivax streblomastigis]
MKAELDFTRLPQHIAIIMDGNGRWAQKNGLERYMGHQEGAVSVRKVVEAAGEIGINYLTLYAFSTENWNRPQEEVDALMALLITTIQRETPDLMKNNVRLQAIGDLERLPQKSKDELAGCIQETSVNTGLTLILALSYSSRWEISKATREIAQTVQDGRLALADINESVVAEHLTTQQWPDPDLLIRTGGEHRISNYLLWQLAYAELYFTPVFWPDFREKDLLEAILDFQKRERRFGKTGEQVKSEK